MFYNDFKNKALNEHKKAEDAYERIFKYFIRHCKALYKWRVKACSTIDLILILINSIANKPKDFEIEIADVRLEKKTFHETEEYSNKAENSLKLTAFGTTAGVSVGTVIAIGTKSALSGPIGIGIGAGTAAVSLLKLSYDNKKIGNKAMQEAIIIRESIQELKVFNERVISIRRKIILLNLKLRVYCIFMNRLKDANYKELSEKDRLRLGTLVNNALTLTHLINEKVDSE